MSADGCKETEVCSFIFVFEDHLNVLLFIVLLLNIDAQNVAKNLGERDQS